MAWVAAVISRQVRPIVAGEDHLTCTPDQRGEKRGGVALCRRAAPKDISDRHHVKTWRISRHIMKFGE
jgi:hypothetical protein